MISKELDRQLTELKASIALLEPPAEVDAAVAAAIAGKRATPHAASSARRTTTPAQIAWFAALAASVAFVAIFHREEPPASGLPVMDAGTRTTAGRDSAPFLPVVPMNELAETSDAMVVPARLSRMSLAQFGLPVDPAGATDSVDTELLVRGDGAVLALRFVN